MIRHGVHQMVSMPVHGFNETAFGVLEVGSAEEGEFFQHDLYFLRALADSVAAAVYRHADRASHEDRAALVAERRHSMHEPQPDWVQRLSARAVRHQTSSAEAGATGTVHDELPS